MFLRREYEPAQESVLARAPIHHIASEQEHSEQHLAAINPVVFRAREPEQVQAQLLEEVTGSSAGPSNDVRYAPFLVVPEFTLRIS